MVYRKTAKVQAGLEARRALLIASATDVISREGIEALSVNSIAERAEVSKGLLYQYFPDMTELRAAVVAELLSSDLAAVREVALPAAVEAFFSRLSSVHLTHFRFASPGHFVPMTGAFARILWTLPQDKRPKDRTRAARAALGAIYGLHALGDGSRNNARAAVLFVLGGLGIAPPLMAF